MGKLIKIIIGLVLIIVAVPAALLGFMYDGRGEESLPIDDFLTQGGSDILYEELHQSLNTVKENEDEELNFELTEAMINGFIYQELKGDGAYNPGPDCETNACKYASETTQNVAGMNLTAGLLGAWVVLDEDRFEINIAFDLEVGSMFTYKTVARVPLEFIDDVEGGRYAMNLDGLKVGRLPVPKALMSAVLGLVPALDLEELVPFGTFDASELSLEVVKSDLAEFVESSGDDPGIKLMGELLGTVLDEGLLRFGIDENALSMDFTMSIIRNSNDRDIPEYLHTMRSAETIDDEVFDYEQYMKNRFDEFIFTKALTGQSYMTIRERSFNRIIYSQMNGFRDTSWAFEYEDSNGDLQSIDIFLEALWFEFYNDDLAVVEIKALFNIDGIKSELVITTEDSLEGGSGEYLLEFKEVTLGKEGSKDHLSIDNLEAFADLIRNFGEFPFGEVDPDGYLVIDTNTLSDLFQDGTVSGTVEVHDILIVDDGIRLYVQATTPALQSILDDYTNEFGTAFMSNTLLSNLQSNLLSPTGIALIDEVETLQTINDGGTVTDDDMEDFMTHYNSLSQTEQTAFMGSFVGLIDPTVANDFNSSFR